MAKSEDQLQHLAKGMRECAACGRVLPLGCFTYVSGKSNFIPGCTMCQGLEVNEVDKPRPALSVTQRLDRIEEYLRELEGWRCIVSNELVGDLPRGLNEPFRKINLRINRILNGLRPL